VVNPLPFDVARERFGGPVVAVAVHVGAREMEIMPPPRSRVWLTRARQLLDQPWMVRAPTMRAWLEAQLANHAPHRGPARQWTARRVFERAYTIAQAEAVRLRAALSPPDLVLAPDVGAIGVLEFYRAREAIDAGRQVTEERLSELLRLAGMRR